MPDPAERPVIDYDKLRALINIDGLQSRENERTTEEAHKQFMENYSSIFVSPEPKKGFPIHSLERRYSLYLQYSPAAGGLPAIFLLF